jgi:asparagine synthase (glutamine-hydrolysing)
MAEAVEVRSPFLDHDLAGFAAQLPADYKMRDGELKWILKQAVAEVLPPNFTSRKKIGFGSPSVDFFTQAFSQYGRDLLLDATSRGRGMLNTAHVAALLRQNQADAGAHCHRLWSLLILESWMRTFIDRADPTDAGPLDLGFGS